MCVAGTGEEGTVTETEFTTDAGGTEVPEILVTAPRIALDMEVFDAIDWTEVLPYTTIGLAGGLSGGLLGALGGEVAGTLGAIESQEDIDLVDLVDIEHDILVVPGVSLPYTPLY